MPCEDELAFFSAKRWGRRNRADLIVSATHCHDAQVAGSFRVSNLRHWTVLVSKSEVYNTVPQHLQVIAVRAETCGQCNSWVTLQLVP